MAHLAISTLGPLTATLDGMPVSGFEYDKVRALLVYLAVEAGQPQARSSLAALLWPDLSERTARRNLSQALTTLRRALGDTSAAHPLVLADTDTLQLNSDRRVAVDVTRFLGQLRRADAHARRSWRTCGPCSERLREAVALYRGDFLSQFFLADSSTFEEWASIQREHLRQRALSALGHLAEWAEWRGAYAEAAEYVRRQVALEPLLEVSHRELMRLLALNGEPAAALAQYERGAVRWPASYRPSRKPRRWRWSTACARVRPRACGATPRRRSTGRRRLRR